MIDRVEYTIIGSYSQKETLDIFQKGINKGFERYCFSPGIALSIIHSEMSGFLDEMNWSITHHFPIVNHYWSEKMESDLISDYSCGVDVVIDRSDIINKSVNVWYLGHLKQTLMGRKNELKCIIETALLTDEQIIWVSKKLSTNSDIDYIKSCTGFFGSVEVSHIELMKKHCGKKGLKASGGIRTGDQACDLVDAGADLLGIGWKSCLEIFSGV